MMLLQEGRLEVDILGLAQADGKIKPGDIIKFVCRNNSANAISKPDDNTGKRYIKKGIDVSFNLGMFDERLNSRGLPQHYVVRLENGDLVIVSGECVITKTTEKEKNTTKKLEPNLI